MNHQPDVCSLTDDKLDALFVAILSRDNFEFDPQAWRDLSLQLNKRVWNWISWPLITNN